MLEWFDKDVPYADLVDQDDFGVHIEQLPHILKYRAGLWKSAAKEYNGSFRSFCTQHPWFKPCKGKSNAAFISSILSSGLPVTVANIFLNAPKQYTIMDKATLQRALLLASKLPKPYDDDVRVLNITVGKERGFFLYARGLCEFFKGSEMFQSVIPEDLFKVLWYHLEVVKASDVELGNYLIPNFDAFATIKKTNKEVLSSKGHSSLKIPHLRLPHFRIQNGKYVFVRMAGVHCDVWFSVDSSKMIFRKLVESGRATFPEGFSF